MYNPLYALAPLPEINPGVPGVYPGCGPVRTVLGGTRVFDLNGNADSVSYAPVAYVGDNVSIQGYLMQPNAQDPGCLAGNLGGLPGGLPGLPGGLPIPPLSANINPNLGLHAGSGPCSYLGICGTQLEIHAINADGSTGSNLGQQNVGPQADQNAADPAWCKTGCPVNAAPQATGGWPAGTAPGYFGFTLVAGLVGKYGYRLLIANQASGLKDIVVQTVKRAVAIVNLNNPPPVTVNPTPTGTPLGTIVITGILQTTTGPYGQEAQVAFGGQTVVLEDAGSNRQLASVKTEQAPGVPGRFTFNISLPVGTYNLRVRYSGNDQYNDAQPQQLQGQVQQSTTALVTSINPQKNLPNTPVAVTVNLQDTLHGSPIQGASVDIYVETTKVGTAGPTDSNGNATLPVSGASFPADGTYHIWAKYQDPNQQFQGATSAQVIFTAQRIATTLQATAAQSVAPLGTLIVSGVLKGTDGSLLDGAPVTVLFGGQQFTGRSVQGAFSVPTTAPTQVGAYQILVSFPGSQYQYAPSDNSNNPITVQVQKAQTQITVNVSPTTAHPGEGVIVSGVVGSGGSLLAGIPVSVQVGGSVFNAQTGPDGSYSIVFNPPGVGQLNIIASVAETVSFLSSQASTSLNVQQGIVAVSLDGQSTAGNPGASLLFSGNITSLGRAVPGAIVELQINGQAGQQATSDQNGQYSFNVQFPNVGEYTLVAVFRGNDALQAGQSGPVVVHISPVPITQLDTSVNLSVPFSVLETGKSGQVTVLVQTTDFRPIAAAEVGLFDNGQPYATAKTGPDGMATINVQFDKDGRHTLKAYFRGFLSGTTQYGSSESTPVDVNVVTAALVPDWLIAGGVAITVLTIAFLANEARRVPPARQPAPMFA